MKILVTGATGFLGKEVLYRLSEEFGKDKVWGTGRNKAVGNTLIQKGYPFLFGDLSDPGFVKVNLNDFTHIVHCAAKASPWGNFQSFYHDNVLSTQNLINQITALENLIFISSPSIYFNYSDRFMVKENAELPVRFVNHYAHTKYLAELEVLKACDNGVIGVVFRPRALIGAGDTVIMPRLLNAYNAGRLRVIGAGDNLCDFTSVKNMAHAVVLAIKAGKKVKGMRFNLTDNSPQKLWPWIETTLKRLGHTRKLKKINYRLIYALAALSELYARHFTGNEPVLTRYGIAALKYSLTLDISEARKHLNYEPIISSEESINEFIINYLNESA
ncbi:MAG: NAD-dependent epimerase/dehydratase family protein [Bacteroidales bacterium]